MARSPSARGSMAPVMLSVMILGLGFGTTEAQEPAPAAGRDLGVRIAFAPDLARQKGWFSDLHCAVSRASRLLEEAIGRKLVVRDRVPWAELNDSEDLYDLRSQLVRGVDHGGADLVVGVLPTGSAPVGPAGRIVEDGLAAYSQGYVVLRVGAPICDTGRLLAHEIAHVFGGIHRAGSGNLMNPTAPGTRIDELNAALFSLHRDRLIREQAPPLRGDMLRMMWRLARADLEAADTWLKVGILAATMGAAKPACEHYERALAIDPRLRTAWVDLGHARLQLGRFEAAKAAYSEALALDPDDGLVHNNLAVVYMSVNQPRRAAAAMDRALSLGYDVPAGLREAIHRAIGGKGTAARAFGR